MSAYADSAKTRCDTTSTLSTAAALVEFTEQPPSNNPYTIRDQSADEHAHALGIAPARLLQSKGLSALWKDGTEDDEEESPEQEVDIVKWLGAVTGGEEELSGPASSLFRAGAARANFMAMDRADVMFAGKELCRRMSAPRVRDLEALRRLAKYLIGAPRLVQVFAWQAAPDHVDTYCDTDFAGCPFTRRSTSGGCGFLGRHCVKFWSSTQKSVTLSSGEAELNGVVKGTCEALGLQSLLRDLGRDVLVRVHADSSAAIGICNRSGVGKVRHLAVGQLWVQNKIKDHSITLHKVLGSENPADLFTKHLGKVQMDNCLGLIQARFATGRPSVSPLVAAEVVPFLQKGYVV